MTNNILYVDDNNKDNFMTTQELKALVFKPRGRYIDAVALLLGELVNIDSYYKVIDNLEQLEQLTAYNDYVYVNTDNTYNYSGNLSHDIRMNIYDNCEGQRLVAYSVHIGSDIRAGYTRDLWVHYESADEMYYHIGTWVNVATVELNGNLCSISACGNYDMCGFYNHETGEQVELSLDLYSDDDLLKSLCDELSLGGDDNLKIVD